MQQLLDDRHIPTLTTTKVAKRLGISVPTVKRLAERGELAGYKIGGWYRFAPSSVEDYLNRHVRPLAA